MAPVEDLANTPEERTRAAPASRSGADEAAGLAAAKLVEVGGSDHIVIVGGGLVGCLCAVVLLRKGFKVHVYERYPDIRSIPSTGRSINLAITSRGLRAIKALGGSLYDDILGTLATQVKGRIIHGADDKVVFQRYGKDDSEVNHSISRIDLNCFLINLAIKEGAHFHFDHALCDSSDFSGPETVGCELHFRQGPMGQPEKQTFLRVKVLCPVIACDGAGSRVRYALRKAGLTDFTEDLLSSGYKEVLFPKPEEGVDFGAKGEDGGEACSGRFGLHIWPRKDHMLMALANRDGSFTGTFYMEMKGREESFETFTDTPEGREKCAAFCQKYYSEALPNLGGLEALVSQLTRNPAGILGTVRAARWAIRGKVVLIGDASHAMVPFFGQGCNCGFEDTLWLSKLLDQHCCVEGRCSPEKCTPENFEACFKALEVERKPNADAICDMALENFVEMSDKSGDPAFQAMKKVENKLENVFPQKFRSRYAMVCYGGEGNVSYANAKHLGEVQATILQKLCQGNTSSEAPAIDLSVAESLIDEILVPEQRKRGIDLSTVKH